MDVMKSRQHVSCLLLAITFLAVLVCFPGSVLAEIAKVTSVKGDVIVNQAGKITEVTSPGLALNDGDQIQTKEGEIQVTFKDGAILKINPHTNISVQERMEKSSSWMSKKTNASRRVTCFTGMAWFKSGSSQTKNYLQTPTAVAGLRGSDGDFGFDNARSYLNMYSGAADATGAVVRGFFQNPGPVAALKSPVYTSLQRALDITLATRGVNLASGITTEQRTINTAQAQTAALAVQKDAAQILVQSNPDPVAKTQAQATVQAVNTSLNAVQVRVEVARVEIVRKAAVQEVQNAQAAGDTQKAAAAQRIVVAATAEVGRARAVEQRVEREVVQTAVALAAGNVVAVQRLAQQVQQDTQQVQQQVQQVQQQAQQVITSVATTVVTTVATTVAPTTAATTTETTAATTVATTSAATTTVEATTTTTSTMTTIPPPTSSTSSTSSQFTTVASPTK